MDALNDWNPWWENKEFQEGIQRNITKEITEFPKQNIAKTIIGIRRSGKSTILYQIIKNLLRTVKAENILLLNFEDIALQNKELDEIIEYYLAYKKPEGMIHLALDEIHNVPNWERTVRKLVDLKKANIYITDSSSHYLSKEYGTVLTGRQVVFNVYPFSFQEYLRFFGVKISEDSFSQSKIKGMFFDYVQVGGFPEVIGTDSATHRRILSNYFQDTLYRDVMSRYAVDFDKLNKISHLAVSYFGKLYSLNRFKKTLGVAQDTIAKYIKYLEEVFLVFSLPEYAHKLTTQIKSPKKMYCIDTGLANVVSFQPKEHHGLLLENAVAVELLRRGYKPGQDLFYWKGKQEIDFLLRRGLQAQGLMNVAWDVGDENTKKREVEGMVEGLRKFRLREGMVITYDYEDEVQIGAKRVRFVPAWKWMLGNY